MFSKREGILIYFYADSFDRVTDISTVNKSFLVWYLRRPILPRRSICNTPLLPGAKMLFVPINF